MFLYSVIILIVMRFYLVVMNACFSIIVCYNLICEIDKFTIVQSSRTM